MTVVRDTSTTHDCSTDAGFRSWGQMISAALASVGLVKTSDTGQIDLTTVSAPAGGSYAGYEIWRFNDTQQGSDPIYFKLEYGRGSTTTRPQLRWTFGTGSNGSGTLSNASSSIGGALSVSPSGSPEFHVAHVDGALMFFDNAQTGSSISSSAFWMLVERARGSNGSVLTGSDAAWMAVGIGNNSGTQVRQSGSWSSPVAGCGGFPSGANVAGKKHLAPLVVGNFYPCIGALAVKSGEIAAGDTGQASIYSTSRSYRQAVNTQTVANAAFWGASGQSCVPALLNE